MSQEDTYIQAIDPSEAAMTPAMEEVPDAPPPAAAGEATQDNPAMRPAQRPNASYVLERLRKRIRTPESAQWINSSTMPIDGGSMPQQNAAGIPATAAEIPQSRRTISQGAALNTLMRAAARQYSPAPMLSQPPMSTGGPELQPAMVNAPQMRGALRQVVRNAQQTQAAQVVPARPVSPAAE